MRIKWLLFRVNLLRCLGWCLGVSWTVFPNYLAITRYLYDRDECQCELCQDRRDALLRA